MAALAGAPVVPIAAQETPWVPPSIGYLEVVFLYVLARALGP